MSDPSSKWYLLTGLFLLGLSIAETISGQALGRFGSTFNRAEDPKTFWGSVVTDYVAAALFIGYFVYRKYMAH